MRQVPRTSCYRSSLAGARMTITPTDDFTHVISQPFIVARMTELLELDKRAGC